MVPTARFESGLCWCGTRQLQSSRQGAQTEEPTAAGAPRERQLLGFWGKAAVKPCFDKAPLSFSSIRSVPLWSDPAVAHGLDLTQKLPGCLALRNVTCTHSLQSQLLLHSNLLHVLLHLGLLLIPALSGLRQAERHVDAVRTIFEAIGPDY